MQLNIEFLYFEGCPHQAKAFELLTTSLREQKIDFPVKRIVIRNDADASRHRFVGSRTIRMNNVDVDPPRSNQAYAKTCRVYVVNGKLSGLPSKEMITDLLEKCLQVDRS